MPSGFQFKEPPCPRNSKKPSVVSYGYFLELPNLKKVGGHYVYNDKKTFLPCHGNRSGFSIRIKVIGRKVEVGGKGVTCAEGATFLGGPGMLARETFKI